jgi:hypothetical protein
LHIPGFASRDEIVLTVRTRTEGPPREARDRFEKHVSAIAGAARRVLLEGGVARLTVDDAEAALRGSRCFSGPLETRGGAHRVDMMRR